MLIDGATWANVRGYGRYTREIVRALARLTGSSPRFSMLVDPATRRRDDLPASVALVEVPVKVPPVTAAAADGARGVGDLLRFRRAAARVDADVLFFPAVYSYFPVRRGPRVAATFPDTIAESLPKQVFPTWKNRLFWSLKCRAAARRADLIVTLTEASRHDVERAYAIHSKPVVVAGAGFDRATFHARRSEVEEADARAALGIGPATEVILAVGGLSPHKNLHRLVLALDALRERAPARDVRLVLVGADRGEDVFFSSRDALLALTRELGLEGRVIFTGFVSDERLGALYRLARTLAFPSLLEGFGLPALEAMASGTPVTASNKGSLPEVVGDAGFLFDPESTADCARALDEAMAAGDTRERAIRTGLAIADGHSWDASAARLLAAFEKLVVWRP